MRVPVSWLREVAQLPEDLTTEAIAERLTAWDLKLEEIISSGVQGPLVAGRVLTMDPEPQKNGKTINWCRVDVGPGHNDADGGRGIVCGAHNFAAGDLVVVALPGAVLPGDFAIAARKTYGHISDGMICSTSELGLPGDASGIIVLPEGAASPGDDALALLGLDDEVLDLEVNPDRAYALSLRGVGRDAALAFGLDYRDPAAIDVPTGAGAYPVRVEDSEACPVFTALTVTGVDQSRATPSWMAQRIEASGMRAISLAVDITNYVMLELGQPIHGYDRALLQGPIVVRRAADGEKLTTLDGLVRTLSGDDLLICDDRGPIGLAGVMGGEEVEMTAATRDVVIEAAYFEPARIGRTARLQKLPSEASKRFERGVDPALAAAAATRVAELLVEHGGGTLEPGITFVGEAPSPAPVSLSIGLPARVTGVDVADSTVVAALEANGCSVVRDGDTIKVTPPTWRPDLTDPYDFVEEVLRFVGYDQVPSVLPTPTGGRGWTRAQQLRQRAGLVLAGEGLVEVKTFPFAGSEDFDKLGLAVDDSRRDQVLLENPLSAEEPGMTTTLLVGLLKTLALNAGRGHADIALVETGRVFFPRADGGDAPIYGVESAPSEEQMRVLNAALPEQPQHVALVMAGDRERSGWSGAGRPVSWADAIAVVRRLADVLHVDIVIEAAERAPWHPGRCGAIRLDGTVIGYAGELHPRVNRAWGVPERTVAAEFDLDALIAAAPEVGPKPQFSAFPVAKEDLALVVDASIPSESLRQVIAGASELIESVRLFDVYTGDQVSEGKKSLAFALRLRAADRTLSDEDIAAARSAVLAATERFGATLR